MDANNLGAVEGVDEALKHEQGKVDIMKKLVGLQNGNAKSVQLWNIQRTIDWFQKKPGDTGSPEVQGKSKCLYIL